jgi:hypothetical protein
MGELLRDKPGSMRAAALFLAGDTGWRVWADLLYSVRTGGAAFEHVMGMQTFDYWTAHPEESAIHDQAMEAFSVPVAASVIAAYDFSAFGTIVDVGGGTGLLLAEILAAHPTTHGILFDMPHVVALAREVIEPRGVLDRCEIRAGSFFETVPKGADAYLLKSIIHDWDDARASSILANCRKAMKAASKLLIIDYVLPYKAEEGRSATGYRTDLEMLVRTPGGRERTEKEFRALLAGTGFEMERVVATASGRGIVEGRPRV